MKATSNYTAVQLITLIVLTVCLSGCKSATDPTPASTDNFLFGELELVDEFNNIVSTDKSGFEVSATDGKRVYTGVSDADGTWKVFNVPAGVYKIEAHAKDGFGDFTESSFASATNVQYVGVGAYQTYRFSLARPISSDMVTGASASIEWRYTYSDEAMTIRKDSTVKIQITVQTRNRSDWSYIVSLVQDSSVNCDTFLERNVSSLTTPNGTGTVGISIPYAKCLANPGQGVNGRTYYLLIRARNSNYGYTSLDENCLKPFVLPITF